MTWRLCCQFCLRISAGDAVHRNTSDAVSSAHRQAAALLPSTGTGDLTCRMHITLLGRP